MRPDSAYAWIRWGSRGAITLWDKCFEGSMEKERKTSNQLSPSTGPKVVNEAGKNPIFSLDMYAMNVCCVWIWHIWNIYEHLGRLENQLFNRRFRHSLFFAVLLHCRRHDYTIMLLALVRKHCICRLDTARCSLQSVSQGVINKWEDDESGDRQTFSK